MSTRGLKFLDKWVIKQLPIIARGDPVTASDFMDQLMTLAEKAGISTHGPKKQMSPLSRKRRYHRRPDPCRSISLSKPSLEKPEASSDHHRQQEIS